MVKKIILVFITLIQIQVYGQDTLGQKFGFGLLQNTTYSYVVINQEIVRNRENSPSKLELDTFKANINLSAIRKDGYGITINFEPLKKGGLLPDAIYSIPLKIALDTNGSTLGMINHYDYKKFIYRQIDSLFYMGVYDTAAVIRYKLMYQSNNSIENLVYVYFKDFFALYGRQYQTLVTYAVGKEIFHPFSQKPFVASGQTTASLAQRVERLFLVNTKIGNTEEERPLLTEMYQNYLKRIRQFNPQIITPAIDLFYNSKYLFNAKKGVINSFYVENGLRVGDETKITSTTMRLLN